MHKDIVKYFAEARRRVIRVDHEPINKKTLAQYKTCGKKQIQNGELALFLMDQGVACPEQQQSDCEYCQDKDPVCQV